MLKTRHKYKLTYYATFLGGVYFAFNYMHWLAAIPTVLIWFVLSFWVTQWIADRSFDKWEKDDD